MINIFKWFRRKPKPQDFIRDRAVMLIDEAELLTDASGEYKRHNVYAKLIKEFPEEKKHNLAFLIESVIQQKRN